MSSTERPQPLILVVDDEQIVLDELEAVLNAAGFVCRCCATVASGIVAAETILPDLILADITLHGESGVEMCQRIQQNPLLADVPVMFLSGSQIPDIIRRTDHHRGFYYLRKPLDSAVLLELIDKALSKGRVPSVSG